MANFRINEFFYKIKESAQIIWIGGVMTLLLIVMQVYFIDEIWEQEKLRQKDKIEEILLAAIERENTAWQLSNTGISIAKGSLNYEKKEVCIIRNNTKSVYQLNDIPDWDKISCQLGYELCCKENWSLKKIEQSFLWTLHKVGLRIYYILSNQDLSGNLLQFRTNLEGEEVMFWEYGKIDCCLIPLGFPVCGTLSLVVIFPQSAYWSLMWDRLLMSIMLLIILMSFFVWFIKKHLEQRRVEKYREDYIPELLHNLRKPLSGMKRKIEKFEMVIGDHMSIVQKRDLMQMKLLIDDVQQKLGRLIAVSVDKLGLKVDSQEFDLLNLVNEVIVQCHSFVDEQKQVSINVDCRMDNTLIYADQQHLFMALVNLLDNSLKYSSSKVNICLTIWNTKKWVFISVLDNGYGILLEEQRKIFKKNYRSKRKNQEHDVIGLGLGLHYVALVVKAHQGKVKVISDGENGSEFIITIKRKS